MSTTQCTQGKLGSLSGLLLTIGIGFALYILIPLLPHIGVQGYAYAKVVEDINNSAFKQVLWFFMNFTEADFFAGFFSSLLLIIGGAVAWRLTLSGSRMAGFPICYGASGLWPWVLASQALSLLLTMYAFNYMALFDVPGTTWTPTFIVVVSTPPALVLLYGAGWRTLLTASILPAVVATPLAYWMSTVLMPLLKIPVGVAFVATMGITGWVLCAVASVLPWMQAQPAQQYPGQPEDVYSPLWSVRRALADFTEPHFWGNEVVTIFLFLGLFLDMIFNNTHGLGGGAAKFIPTIVLSQFIASGVGVFLYARKFENKGWYATYVPVVSVGPFCVLAFGPTLGAAIVAGTLGGILGAPLASFISQRLPSGVHGFVGNVFSMSICTTMVWAAMKCLPWFK